MLGTNTRLVMSLKDRIRRAMRANLNEVLDRVSDFESDGGFRKFVDPLADELGFDSRPAPPKNGGQKTIKEYYANLEVPMGSDLETVKESYRRLMRKYHPDRHSHDPEMEELATDLSQELTRAYQAVESYIQTGKY